MPHRFFTALREGDLSQFDALLVEMPDVKLSELRQQGKTLLHVAAECGLVGELLQRMDGVDAQFLAVQDRAGLEALHWAATRGDVDELLSAGANVHAIDNDGNTPLLFAAQSGHLNATEALLRAGASGLGNMHGETPAHRAAEGGHADVLRALVEHGRRMPLSFHDWPADQDPEDVADLQQEVELTATIVALADLSVPGVATPPSLVADLQSVVDGTAFAPGASPLTEAQRADRIRGVIFVYSQEDRDVQTRPARAVAAAQAEVAPVFAQRSYPGHYMEVTAAHARAPLSPRLGPPSAPDAGLA